MNLVLVFLLMLTFLRTGQVNADMDSSACHIKCEPGYHKDSTCGEKAQNGSALYTCKKCENNSFTALKNTRDSCIRCTHCKNYQREKKPCTITSDRVCECIEGYYNEYPSSQSKNLDCQECNCKSCAGSDNPDYKLKCKKFCPSCFRDPGTTSTKPTAPSSTAPPTTTTTSTSPSTTTSTSMTTTASRTTDPGQSNSVNQMSWLVLVGVMVTFLVLFWLLLLFTRNPIRYPDCCLCWSTNKDVQPPVEDPIFSEQRSHQGSDTTTLSLNISEQTPMMPLSQSSATPEHLAHIDPVLPKAEHKAARQDVHLEHWPAIVLYAIIKEVPLRRWKEFLRLLSVTDQHMERVELETSLGLGSMERQYQMLRLWSQRSSASLNDVFSALHYMDLSGCAQLLQESLEKLQWRPELRQGFTDHGFNGVMQNT